MPLPRGVDVNKRTVTTQFYRFLQGKRFDHNMASLLIFLSFLLATSWPKLRLATNECKFKLLVTFLFLTTNKALFPYLTFFHFSPFSLLKTDSFLAKTYNDPLGQPHSLTNNKIMRSKYIVFVINILNYFAKMSANILSTQNDLFALLHI